jgi:L-fuculose-phosphate aldolase
MSDVNISVLKRNVVAIGRLLWEKNLASALNGNISVRVSAEGGSASGGDSQRILLTATKTCLGLLQEKDVLLMGLDGKVLEEGDVSSENPLHTAIYKNFSEVSAVIHTHTIFANAYFLENEKFTPRIFEAKFWFGELEAVPQMTPTVTDVGPVIEALKKNGIAVMRNHGVVAVSKDLFGCFLLVQTLEEGLQTEAMARVFSAKGAENQRQVTSDKRQVV